ncbi:Zinc finger, C6HC-type [Corchorus olitorius]|uniref:RBR-type E3 ubiquitin transferase n=1 Tax=Corchorus olitorius TaxID=93759 RepID=A0A1R3I084_9ROSI|nr:Zinc finger, C6HC-type [Corchorus olitorius]
MKRFRMSLRSKLLAASSSKNNQHATNNSSKKVQIQTLTPEDLEILSNYNNYELLADQDSNYNYVCQICFESKLLSDSFEVKGCSHFYCIECIINYVSSKLDDNVTLIPCPEANCEGRLDPDFCHEILPSSLFERWGDALCESAVASHEKFYCPYEDCSALLIKDDDDDRLLNNNEGQHTNFPCIVCKRNLCVQCKVPWHSGMDCREFQKSKNPNYEEAMLVRICLLLQLRSSFKFYSLLL